MRREDIEVYIAKRQAVSDRNYIAYQESGESRYLRQHDRAEGEIQIARQALSAADDHQAAGVLRAELTQLCGRAIKILHTNDDPTQLLKDMQAIGEHYGVSNPWKEAKK